MTRALLFDLGNVLVHFSHQRACEQIAALCPLSAEEVWHVLFQRGLELQYEAGRVSTDEFHRRFEQAAGCRIERSELLRAGCEIFWPNPSIEPVVEKLKEAGHRLVLVSNTNPAHIEHVDEHFAIVRHFQTRVLSYEVGACKPSRLMFEAAVRAAGCPPAECFYIDDVPEYAKAAKALGIDAVAYTDTSALVEELATRGVAV